MKSVFLMVCTLALVVSLPLSQPASAVVAPSSAAISSNCSQIEQYLKRVEEDDTAKRILRGRIYQSQITERLMVPLNQRIANNKLDGSALVSVTASFDSAITKFANTYKDYENALAALVRSDCDKQPQTFYQALVSARKLRQDLSEADKQLLGLLATYRERVVAFKNGEIK